MNVEDFEVFGRDIVIAGVLDTCLWLINRWTAQVSSTSTLNAQ